MLSSTMAAKFHFDAHVPRLLYRRVSRDKARLPSNNIACDLRSQTFPRLKDASIRSLTVTWQRPQSRLLREGNHRPKTTCMNYRPERYLRRNGIQKVRQEDPRRLGTPRSCTAHSPHTPGYKEKRTLEQEYDVVASTTEACKGIELGVRRERERQTPSHHEFKRNAGL